MESQENLALENYSGINYMEEASVVLSIMYGLLVVVLAVVFKVSENITTTENLFLKNSNISKNYLCVLFAISLMWLACFKIHSVWKRKQNSRKVSKSLHASNKWLKAIVAIFGFSVVVKESLEIIGVTQIHNVQCRDKFLYYITPIFHSLFALGQVVFLFFYAKIHIQDFTFMSRVGIMHAMATNLAVWISIVSDETNHALAYERYHHNHSNLKGSLANLNRTRALVLKEVEANRCNITESIYSIFAEVASNATEYLDGLFKGECFCHTPVCSLVARADQFLSPMLIEFCLIASCLLYVTWSNVGKSVKHHHVVTKPSYKFYKSYKGVMAGTLTLLGSVIVMTLLASIESGFDPDHKSYSTEYKSLFIYDTFLALCNCFVLIACCAGFYLFYIIHSSKREKFHAGLDVVLLFICLIGPLLVGLFSIISLSAGPSESKLGHWEMSLICSVTDIAVSIVQILLIVYGLSREPSTQSLSNPNTTANFLQKSDSDVDLKKMEKNRLVVGFQENNHHEAILNKRIGWRQEASNAQLEEFEADAPILRRTQVQLNALQQESFEMEEIKSEPGGSETSSPTKSLSSQAENQPEIKVPEWEKDRENFEQDTKEKTVTSLTENHLIPAIKRMGPRNSRMLHPLRPRPVPRKNRIVLRDIMMFLVISNSCLWMLLSLNGTAYKVYSYQSEYFGHSAWTTLSSVTAPLTIFLKLHFAACFFEIWSYS